MQYGGMIGIHPRSTSSGGSAGGGVSLSGDELLQAQRLMHYKTYGEESYVFQHKDVWESLLQSFVAINDIAMSTLAMNFALEQGGHVGNYIGGIYGMGEANWGNLASVKQVVDDIDAITVGLNHPSFKDTMMRLIVRYKPLAEIEESDDYISAVVNSDYGQEHTVVTTAYSHPAILIKGTSVPASNSKTDNGYWGYCHITSGYKYTNLSGETISLIETKVATGQKDKYGNPSGDIENPFTPEDVSILRVVNSLPQVSWSYNYDGPVWADFTITSTVKHTYIPLYFED